MTDQYPENVASLAEFQKNNPTPRRASKWNPKGELHNSTPPKDCDVVLFERTGLPLYPLGLAKEPTPLEYVAYPIVPKGSLSMLFGPGGHMKSTLALYLATCVAADLPFCGKPTMRGKVFYLDYETDISTTHRNACKVARGLGLEKPPDDLIYWSPFGGENHMPLKLSEMAAILAEEKPMLTIVDSVGYALRGDAIGSRDVIEFTMALRRLGTVLQLFHESEETRYRKDENKKPYGSVFFENSGRSIFHIETAQQSIDQLAVKLVCTKANYSAKGQPLTLKATFGSDSIKLANEEFPEGTFQTKQRTVEEKVIEAIEELDKATNAQIQEKTGQNHGSVNNVTGRLLKAGKIAKVGKEGKAAVYSISHE